MPWVVKIITVIFTKYATTGDGILVRESGTEPVIRVMVEADTKEICEKYVDSVIEVIRAKGHMAE